MSRLIKKPIIIDASATIAKKGDGLVVKGPKGELSVMIPAGVAVAIEGANLTVSSTDASGSTAQAGTLYANVKNAMTGVTTGFVKVLEIEGVGYRAVLEGKELVLFLGYALPVRVPVPENVVIAVDKNAITVTGIDTRAILSNVLICRNSCIRGQSPIPT